MEIPQFIKNGQGGAWGDIGEKYGSGSETRTVPIIKLPSNVVSLEYNQGVQLEIPVNISLGEE